MTTTTSAEQLVRDFCAAWVRRDPEELVEYFTDDGVWHNIPMRPTAGREALLTAMQRFLATASAAEFDVLHVAASGNVVMTERIDRFTLGEKQIELPVAGVFELRDGKIAAWRDYFDLASWTKQQAG